MASLPYPLNRLYTHIVSVIATTQSACILMSVWVWQGCHTLLQIPILLFLNNMFFCSSVFSKTTCSHVLLSFPKTMFSCSLVFPQKPVLMFFCLSQKPCSHVLLSFPKKTMFSLHPCLYVAKKNGWEQRSQPLSLELCLLFSKADSLLRTYACACTALCAEIRVDRILFAFWDCLYWALANTCTACDAVVTNYVSHN